MGAARLEECWVALRCEFRNSSRYSFLHLFQKFVVTLLRWRILLSRSWAERLCHFLQLQLTFYPVGSLTRWPHKMRGRKELFRIFAWYIWQRSAVKDHSNFDNHSHKFLIFRSSSTDSFLQTPFICLHKSLKYSPPLGCLLKVECPPHMFLCEMLLHSRVIKDSCASRAADLSVLSSSDATNEGLPRPAVNLLKLPSNASAVMLVQDPNGWL